MFKKIKEFQELKKLKLELEVSILGQIYNVTKVFDSIPSLLKIVEELQNLEGKELIDELTKNLKNLVNEKD